MADPVLNGKYIIELDELVSIALDAWIAFQPDAVPDQAYRISLANFINTLPGGTGTKDDKEITALVTTVDGQDSGASITNIPIGYVQVMVNGRQKVVGDAVKTKDCYWSGDAGVTARDFDDIIATDTLHWNGSIAGFELAVTDIIDLNYNG